MTEHGLAEFYLEVPGPFALHNFRCPVCWDRPAVYVLNTGIFEPCWECQERGYALLRLPRWLARFLRRHRG